MLIRKSLIGLTLTEIMEITIFVGPKYMWNLRLRTSTSHHTLRHMTPSSIDWRFRGRRTRWKCQKPMLTFCEIFENRPWTDLWLTGQNRPVASGSYWPLADVESGQYAPLAACLKPNFWTKSSMLKSVNIDRFQHLLAVNMHRFQHAGIALKVV